GDFNGNGRVDIGDATYVAYMVVGKVPEDLKADFNGNGRVDIGDAAKIAYYLVGKISEL
ncbi:MAG: dockerin type I repeat-containing protein, partial [Methanosarcinales archaeon]